MNNGTVSPFLQPKQGTWEFPLLKRNEDLAPHRQEAALLPPCVCSLGTGPRTPVIQCPGRCPQGGCGQGGGREPAAAPTVGRGLRSGLHSQFTPAFPTSSSHPVPCPGPSLSPSEGSLPTATCGTRMQPAAGFQAPLPPSPAGSQPKLPSSHPPWAGVQLSPPGPSSPQQTFTEYHRHWKEPNSQCPCPRGGGECYGEV